MESTPQQKKDFFDNFVGSNKLIKVLFIEKCNLVRKAIQNTINKFSFIESVIDIDSVYNKKYDIRYVNVILLGISVVPDECLKMVEVAKNQAEYIGIISLTTNISPDVANLLVKGGVHSILDETSTEKDLEIAIQATANGNSFSSHSIYEKISEKSHTNTLTKTELIVLSMILKGDTNYQIAKNMYISKKTVEAHLTRVYKKIGANSRSQAILRARDLNLYLNEG